MPSKTVSKLWIFKEKNLFESKDSPGIKWKYFDYQDVIYKGVKKA